MIGRVRPYGGLAVRGNHDRAVLDPKEVETFNPIAAEAVRWTRNSLTPENLAWLSEMPVGPIYEPALPGTQFVHGSPGDEDELYPQRILGAHGFCRQPGTTYIFWAYPYPVRDGAQGDEDPGHSSQLCV